MPVIHISERGQVSMSPDKRRSTVHQSATHFPFVEDTGLCNICQRIAKQMYDLSYSNPITAIQYLKALPKYGTPVLNVIVPSITGLQHVESYIGPEVLRIPPHPLHFSFSHECCMNFRRSRTRPVSLRFAKLYLYSGH